MHVRPFKLINKTEFAFIDARAREVLSEWIGKWLVDKEIGASALAADETKDSIRSDRASWWRVSIAPEIWVGAYVPAGLFQVLDTALSGDHPDMIKGLRSPLLRELMNKALFDLAKSMVDGFLGEQGQADVVQQAPEAETWRYGSGAALVELELEGERFCLVLSAGLLDRVLEKSVPKWRGPAGDLVSIVEALATQPAELEVWLGEAELELAAIQSIAAGDVIRLQRKIDQPLYVCLKDNKDRELCAGFPGTYQGRKALQLTHSR